MERISYEIFVISAVLQNSKYVIDTNLVGDLESAIDYMTEQTPALTNFIFPYIKTDSADIGIYISNVHIARCLCREAERYIVEITDNGDILQFMNRLSDYLFTFARYVTSIYKIDEINFKYDR